MRAASAGLMTISPLRAIAEAITRRILIRSRFGRFLAVVLARFVLAGVVSGVAQDGEHVVDCDVANAFWADDGEGVGFDRGEEVSPFPLSLFPAARGVGGEGAGCLFERRVERRGAGCLRKRRERADDHCLMRRLLRPASALGACWRAIDRRPQPRVFAVVAFCLEQFRLFAPSGDVVADEGDGDAFAVETAAPERVAGAARLDLQPCAGNAGNAVQTRPCGPRLAVVRDFHF